MWECAGPVLGGSLHGTYTPRVSHDRAQPRCVNDLAAFDSFASDRGDVNLEDATDDMASCCSSPGIIEGSNSTAALLSSLPIDEDETFDDAEESHVFSPYNPM